jgi:Raf kinase inhibitor-like YbhB/YbcL family protein
MRRVIYALLLFIVLFGCTNNASDNGLNRREVSNMKIYSPEFNDNAMIPTKFTCQGQDINPQLLFEDIPEDAQSLVLIMDDPDAPMGTWVHWVLFNMPVDVTGIPEDSVPDNAVQGLNSWPKNNYGGPCPPSGTHRYFFKLYALDSELELDDTATKKDVEQAMQGHIIERAEYVGLFKKE